MTVHRDGWDGPITFQCDGCGELLETGEDEFKIALREVKEIQGWKIIKYKTKWFHICSVECFREVATKYR